MPLTATEHKKYIQTIIDGTFTHQQNAANKAHAALEQGSRAVVIAAEMQSGKSGIALALACQQRLSLDDQALCERKQLKDTLYLVTMADTALLTQAKQDLQATPNIVVSNFNHFQSTLNTNNRTINTTSNLYSNWISNISHLN